VDVSARLVGVLVDVRQRVGSAPALAIPPVILVIGEYKVDVPVSVRGGVRDDPPTEVLVVGESPPFGQSRGGRGRDLLVVRPRHAGQVGAGDDVLGENPFKLPIFGDQNGSVVVIVTWVGDHVARAVTRHVCPHPSTLLTSLHAHVRERRARRVGKQSFEVSDVSGHVRQARLVTVCGGVAAHGRSHGGNGFAYLVSGNLVSHRGLLRVRGTTACRCSSVQRSG